jgi:hypothetical protein
MSWLLSFLSATDINLDKSDFQTSLRDSISVSSASLADSSAQARGEEIAALARSRLALSRVFTLLVIPVKLLPFNTRQVFDAILPLM